ncbi:type II secretion system F family protein [Psychromicrobium xiongbiense]|uniref:type II secretion system F family protein n=1 Tax=Psychromicrobium xiongbiense TaxID=3051184 RepID=UPI002557B5E7|nr:type II secretion system F family protein [Psychromicrobium sp. YIM S02556]
MMLWIVLGAAAFLCCWSPRPALLAPLRGQGASDDRLRRVGTGAGRAAQRVPYRVEAADVIALVRQISALLQGGRGTSALWQEIHTLWARTPGRGEGTDARTRHSHDALTALLGRVEAAARLGLRVSPVIEDWASSLEMRGSWWVRIQSRTAGSSPSAAEALGDLAAAIAISERSGAPLAALLGHLAEHWDERTDAQAQRRTALAGPQATARILGWLPLLGLLAGYVMGVDPLGALLGSGVGWVALGIGIALMVLSRWWMAALIHQAASLR